MDIRSIKEAGFITRFIHIVVLAAIVATGIHFGSRALITGLTVAWFVIFAAVYLLVKPRDGRHHRT
jgi:hypothetical protein